MDGFFAIVRKYMFLALFIFSLCPLRLKKDTEFFLLCKDKVTSSIFCVALSLHNEDILLDCPQKLLNYQFSP